MSNPNPKTDHLMQYNDKGLGTIRGKSPAIALRLPRNIEGVLKEVDQALRKLKLSQADYLRMIIYDQLKKDGIYPDAQGDFDRTKIEILIKKFQGRNKRGKYGR